MTGVELVRAVRARRPDIPALIVTGFAETAGVASDVPYLTKPFRQSDLAGSVLKVMSGTFH
jgi:CheY-like chemotaxis protein